jgi:hypothetical protein
MMCRRLQYRIRSRSKYVLTRLERSSDGNGRQSGSFRVVGEYESAAEAERARMALQADEDKAASEPGDDGT